MSCACVAPTMLEELQLCKRIQHCCATLQQSRYKRNVGSYGLKRLTGFKHATGCANERNMQHPTIGSLRDDNGDSNENGKKAIGLFSKTTTLHVHHAFLCISLPSLHDYKKLRNFTFCRGREQKRTTFFVFS